MKKGKGKNSGLLPNSFRIISSCLKTVSANASTVVRSAGASVAASISASADDRRDQVTWAGFDKLELGPNAVKHVLLLGYQNGFQVFDVEDASNFSELVSKRDGPVTFLQMLPIPAKSDNGEGFRSSYPLLLVVAGDQPSSLNLGHTSCHPGGLNRDGAVESQSVNHMNSPTAVSFYSFRSNSFVKVLKFRSAVCMVRCSSQIVAVGLPTQIYCVDALTLENKFSVLTYPVPQFGAQGPVGINFGYGPMAIGPRWLAFASNNPLVLNTGRLSPKNLTPSPGVSPSTSPSSGSLMARYAMESSKQLASGIINLSDMGYKKLSRYCSDLLPDGASSPVPLGSGRRVGRAAASEMENAGVVVVKDFISRAVISQFRAHTSPISALSFDPSGTLLVTASVHGNNINVFRIMPSCTYNESGNHIHDWSSAHVHLYKLHRGIRSAIIQDICFSHYSQWIAIISNKGTCHIYVLSPFGGDAGFGTLNFHSDDATLYPVLTAPWWSTSSFIMNQHFTPPPPPAGVLSVVTRIKDSNSGLLNSVTNAAASAAGKVSVPSGAVTAVFHNSMSRGVCDSQLKTKSMEHLLVYSPSGYVVQYELLPLVGMELGDTALRNPSGSFAHTLEEEFGVKVEPVQWWDVCRRSDWPEREEPFSGTTFDRKEDNDIKQMVKCDSIKLQEKYLSNAEVQINSGRFPIWQKSKICFHVMSIPRVKGHVGGELEIEQCLFHELEIKRKDLLPVFDHFHGIKASWNDRGLGETYPSASSLGIHRVRDKFAEETVICHSNPASVSSTESSSGGSSRRIENLLDLEQMSAEKSTAPITEIMNMLNQEIRMPANFESSLLKQRPLAIASLPLEQSNNNGSHIDDTINGLSLVQSDTLPGRSAITKAAVTSDACRITNDPILTVDHFHSAMQISTKGSTPSRQKNLAASDAFIQEGYCKPLDLELDGCCGLAEDVTDDVDCSKELHGTANPGEDVENDDFLVGMFSFSEEG